MGCACDSYKLLLSNIPVSVTESALISSLSQFGHVVQMGLSPDPAGVSLQPVTRLQRLQACMRSKMACAQLFCYVNTL